MKIHTYNVLEKYINKYRLGYIQSNYQQPVHYLIMLTPYTLRALIPVPLNSQAIEILERQKGEHPTYVFTYNGKTVGKCTTRAWHNALKREKNQRLSMA